jgi:hypothetical protein
MDSDDTIFVVADAAPTPSSTAPAWATRNLLALISQLLKVSQQPLARIDDTESDIVTVRILLARGAHISSAVSTHTALHKDTESLDIDASTEHFDEEYWRRYYGKTHIIQ